MNSPMRDRVWLHQLKGRICGTVVWEDDEWVHIRLTDDAWADARRWHREPAGSSHTYRKSRMVEVEEEVM